MKNMSDQRLSEDWQLLTQVAQVFRTLSDTFSDQADMHRGQAVLLYTIARQDGMTQSEIASQLSLQGATVTNMLQKLEESGLVIRQRDAEDNRLVRVYATGEGKRKDAELQEQFLKMQELIFRDITPQERESLRRMLHRLIVNMSSTR